MQSKIAMTNLTLTFDKNFLQQGKYRCSQHLKGTKEQEKTKLQEKREKMK